MSGLRALRGLSAGDSPGIASLGSTSGRGLASPGRGSAFSAWGSNVAGAFVAGAGQKKIAGISRASRASTGFFPSATS